MPLSFDDYQIARDAIDELVTEHLQGQGIEAYVHAQESGDEPERLPDGGFSFEVVIRPA